MVSNLVHTPSTKRKLEINLSPPSTPSKMGTTLAGRNRSTYKACNRDDLADPLTSPRDDGSSCNEDEEVASDDESVTVESNVLSSDDDSNLVLEQKAFVQFVTDNFVCKQCSSCLKVPDLVTVRVGCASNVFWKCSSKYCGVGAAILAKQVSHEHTSTVKTNYNDISTNLGDYDINREVILACQMSGGGARMASTIGGCLSISTRSIWINNFSKVEQLIGKVQVRLGKQILEENMLDEIAASPMDLVLNKAMLTMLSDGGWDQRASGKAYDSTSGRVVSVGGLTRKVCHLVYYSKV
jgi:hypothetical protein